MTLQIPDVRRIQSAHGMLDAGINWQVERRPLVCWPALVAGAVVLVFWVSVLALVGTALDKEAVMQDEITAEYRGAK